MMMYVFIVGVKIKLELYVSCILFVCSFWGFDVFSFLMVDVWDGVGFFFVVFLKGM